MFHVKSETPYILFSGENSIVIDSNSALSKIPRFRCISTIIMSSRIKSFYRYVPILLIFISGGFVYSAIAQNSGFVRIGTDQGLSQSSVYGIAQDQLGYIWIGTADGLNRYDGKEIKTFYHDPKGSQSLPDNFIRYLISGRDHVLFMSTNAGLVRYQQTTNTFQLIDSVKGLPDFQKSIYHSQLLEDEEETVWSVGFLGLFSLKKGENKLTHHPVPDEISGSAENISTILQVGDELFLGTPGRILAFDKDSGSFSIASTFEDGTTPILLTSDQRGRIWFTFQEKGSLWVADVEQNETGYVASVPEQVKEYPFSGIHFMKEVSAENFLIGTHDDGLIRFTPGKNPVIRAQFVYDSTDPASISMDAVTRILVDRDGLIWVGTDSGGLNMKDENDRPFKHYSSNHTSPFRIHDNMIKSLFFEGDDLWYGTYDKGFGNLNLKTGDLNYWEYKESHPALSIWHISRYDSESLLMGSNFGLHFVNENSGKMETFPHMKADSFKLPVQRIVDVVRSGDTLWTATNYGFKIFDLRTEQWGNPPEYLDSEILKSSIEVIEKSDQTLLLGSYSNGFYRINLREKTVEKFRNDPDNNESLSHNSIKTILRTSDNEVWVGTISGLNKFNQDEQTFRRWTTSDGLPNDYIYGLMEDKRGYIWISSNKGLTMFNPDTNSFKNFTVSQGLQSMEFNTNAYAGNQEGKLVFGGINGINGFSTDSVRTSTNPFPIILTGLYADNEPVEIEKEAAFLSEVTLERGQKNITFEFQSIAFREIDDVNYSYMLEGFDKFWTESGRYNFARYTNLPAGTYRFRAQNLRAAELSPVTELSVIIKVVPTIWNTWWFRFIITVFILVGVAIFIRLIVRSRMEKQRIALEKKAEIERERNRIASDIHDEVGSSLTRISLLSELIRTQKDDTEKNSKRIEEISTNATRVLSNLDEIVWALNPQNDSTARFVDYIIEFVSEYLQDFEISLRIDAEENMQEVELGTEVRHDAFLCIREALTNVVRHANASMVTLHIFESDKKMNVKISDNGCGFKPENVDYFSNGLKNMGSRIQKYGGKVEITSEIGLGTSVLLEIPT